MSRIFGKKHFGAVFVVIIILLQLAMMLFVSAQKKEYHIDEIYSYILSNSYETDRISNADKLWGEWVNGESFRDFVVVNPGQRFAYKKVYDNNGKDCHPPLYYWILHTLCSFFPNVFSKWLGLGINIVLFLISDILIYAISCITIKARQLRPLPMLLYGFSLAAIDTVTFIRMYMLLTVWALLFTYVIISAIKKAFTKKTLLLMFVITYLGAMTQYYFVVYAFCATLALLVQSAEKKQWKTALCIGITELSAVAAMLLSYPYALVQITGSSTNNIGNEVVRTLFDFKLWAYETVSLSLQSVSLICFSRILSAIITAVLIAAFLILLIKEMHSGKSLKQLFGAEIILITISVAATCLLIAYIGGSYVYVRYIYFIFPLFYVLAVIGIDCLSQKGGKVNKRIILLAAILAVSNAALCIGRQRPHYLCLEQARESRKIETQKEAGLIVSCVKKTTAIPTGNFTKISRCSDVYIDTIENLVKNRVAEEYFLRHEKCLLYVPTSRRWTKVEKQPKEIIREILHGDKSINCSYYAKGSLGEYYLLEKK